MTDHLNFKKLRKIGIRLAQPDIMFFLLPWLMILLIAGTIAQKEIGLYQAEKIFFSSWVLWWGFIPFPGGLTTLGLIFINLMAKFVFKSKWSWRGSGTVIAHFGILLLFVGALFTSATSKEGFMLIPEGQSTNRVLDYYKKAFYVYKNDTLIKAVDFKAIVNKSYDFSDIPFDIRMIDSCQNCGFVQTTETQSNRRGLAEKVTLKDMPLQKEKEANLSGVTFSISGAKEQNGIYVSTEAAPHPVNITINNDLYRLQFQKEETSLPFTFTLNDFSKGLHPGTEIASHFYSDLEIQDNQNSWTTRINMNEPLRYKGYTFFQSSYADTPAGQATILAVVKNDGWLFPYISTIIIGLGLSLHLIIRLRGQYE